MTKMNEMKRVPVISCEVSLDDEMFPVSIPRGWLKLSCINGEQVEVNTTTLTPEMMAQAMLHGLKQKFVDAAAIPCNPDTGKSATPDDKWEAVNVVIERVLRGEWNAARGEGCGSGNGLLFRALVRLYPTKTANDLRAYLDGKTPKEQAALRANPKVKPIIEALRAEDEARGAKAAGVDTDALLDELND